MEQQLRGSMRPSEVAGLTEFVNSTGTGLAICSVSGPGGVGKTYLVEEVLASLDLGNLGFLHLAVSGVAQEERSDFFALVAGRLALRRLPPPALQNRDYFPQTRKVADLHDKVVRQASAQLAGLGIADDIKKHVLTLIKEGQELVKHVPHPVAAAVAGLDVGAVSDAVQALLPKRRIPVPGPVRRLFGITLQDLVREKPQEAAAEALLSDLTASLAGYRQQDKMKLTQEQIVGVSKLLLVIDDYEALAPVLGTFLFGHLVPSLAEAGFTTRMIVVGRDDLELTHLGWSQHAKRWIRERMRLSAFDRDTAFRRLAETAIPRDRWEHMFQATYGFPFLLDFAIVEATSPGAESALFAKQLFERTTRWMTPEERSWFKSVCYLDVINEDTLGRLFPRSEVVVVQDWFEKEASIRDPLSSQFRMRPLIRDRCLQYLEMRSPSGHAALLRKAQQIDDGQANAQ